jgi:anaerobic selenocysteine-containing dehydrogenase
VAEICDVPAARVVEAAELLGTSERLLSTVLQGFYQSNQATAARAPSTTSTSSGG